MQRKSSEKGWNTMKDYNDTEFDKAVKSAVAPVFEADAELNRKVMYAAVVGNLSETRNMSTMKRSRPSIRPSP